MIKRLLTNLAILTLLTWGTALYAQDRIDWSDLSLEERRILQNLEPQWNELSPERQLRLRRGANRWQQMQPRERAAAQQQQQRFKELPQQQRRIINQRFLRFNSLERSEQVRLRNIQRRYQNLSQEQRLRLRDQFERQAQQEKRDQAAGNPEANAQDTARDADKQRRVQEVIRQNRNVLRPNPTRQRVQPAPVERPRPPPR